MGHHGGRKHFYRGIVTYMISPLHLNVFAGISPMNFMRRIGEEFFYIFTPMLIGWGVYKRAEHLHHKHKLKKPGDFDDEDDIIISSERALPVDEHCPDDDFECPVEEENEG